MPSKRKVVAGVALILAACLVWLWMIPASKPKVIGKISPADLAEIERIGRREIWNGTFPNWSWESIKLLPSRVYLRASIEIKTIQVFDGLPPFGHGPSVIVQFANSKPDAISAPSDLALHKTPKGWKPVGSGLFFDDSITLR